LTTFLQFTESAAFASESLQCEGRNILVQTGTEKREYGATAVASHLEYEALLVALDGQHALHPVDVLALLLEEVAQPVVHLHVAAEEIHRLGSSAAVKIADRIETHFTAVMSVPGCLVMRTQGLAEK
jgi:hypothetical protein